MSKQFLNWCDLRDEDLAPMPAEIGELQIDVNEIDLDEDYVEVLIIERRRHALPNLEPQGLVVFFREFDSEDGFGRIDTYWFGDDARGFDGIVRCSPIGPLKDMFARAEYIALDAADEAIADRHDWLSRH